MEQPSRQLTDRYQLRLSRSWIEWFDDQSSVVQAAGLMRCSLPSESICVEAPEQIWPGFMLPDTLPLIGNEYGDWICARILSSGELGELVYWYHGGGDWIPVGHCLGEALLHDAVDQFRDLRTQMIRGAFESREDDNAEVLERLRNPDFMNWLGSQLVGDRHSVSQVKDLLDGIVGFLREDRHVDALEVLYRCGWAVDATACDLIEHTLQAPVRSISDKNLAEKCAIPWYPDFVNLLFDTGQVSPATRETIQTVHGGSTEWLSQDWKTASRIAHQVLRHRDDLGWAFTIAGWGLEREGRLDEAMHVYWRGRLASSFADQSVRINSHCLADVTGKFATERLLELQQRLLPEQQAEPYLSRYLIPQPRSISAQIHDFWWEQGEQLRSGGDFAGAYSCYYRCGWDLGVSRLTDYIPILDRMVHVAHSVGWVARARVAQTHLACLRNRTS